MSDLISRDSLLEDLRESVKWLHKIYGDMKYEDEKRICSAEIATFTEVIMRVKEAPSVDAVEVVRCKDCVYHGRCTYEAVFITSGFENPHCCAGWRKEKKDAVD